MPEMSVPPPNQCFADGSDGVELADGSSAAPASPQPSVQPTAPFAGTEGAEGAANAGSDELVRRFASEGGGGAPGAPGALNQGADSCLADDLKAVGSCGATVLVALGTGGLVAVCAGLTCAGAALTVVSCHTKNDEVSGR